MHARKEQERFVGTLTIERSPFYFVATGESWNRVDEASELEEEFARSVMEHLAVAEKTAGSGDPSS